MEPWMHYEVMLPEVFQQRGAYRYPFGSHNLGWLYERSDADLQRVPIGRLRDQAVSVDDVFAEWKGAYLTLWQVGERLGLLGALDQDVSRAAHSLRRIQTQQRR